MSRDIKRLMNFHMLFLLSDEVALAVQAKEAINQLLRSAGPSRTPQLKTSLKQLADIFITKKQYLLAIPPTEELLEMNFEGTAVSSEECELKTVSLLLELSQLCKNPSYILEGKKSGKVYYIP